MKPNSTWYVNSQRIRILMMSVIISGYGYKLSITNCLKLVANVGLAVRTQLVDDLLTNLLKAGRILRVQFLLSHIPYSA